MFIRTTTMSHRGNNDNISRKTQSELSKGDILERMKKLGINIDALAPLTKAELSDLLQEINHMITSKQNSDTQKGATNRSMLSPNDKKILRALIMAEGDVSMIALSRILQIPVATLLRRRKRLEILLTRNYSIKYEKFGLEQVTFLVAVDAKGSSGVGKVILSLPGITKIVRILSDKAELRVEAVLKSHKDIVELAERIKAIEGVRNVFWIESIGVVGEKKETDLSIIDSA